MSKNNKKTLKNIQKSSKITKNCEKTLKKRNIIQNVEKQGKNNKKY